MSTSLAPKKHSKSCAFFEGNEGKSEKKMEKLKVFDEFYLDKEKDILLTSKNLQVSDSVHELYKYFLYNGRIQDILNYNRGYLDSYSRRILEKIANAEQDWENECPEGVADMIKDRGMFGYKLKYILE